MEPRRVLFDKQFFRLKDLFHFAYSAGRGQRQATICEERSKLYALKVRCGGRYKFTNL